MDWLSVLDYSFRWAEIVTGLKFEKTICWLCSPDCINLCQNLISCLEHFPFKSFRQELSNINLQVYLRRAHNAYFRTRYVARPFFGNTTPEFYIINYNGQGPSHKGKLARGPRGPLVIVNLEILVLKVIFSSYVSKSIAIIES